MSRTTLFFLLGLFGLCLAVGCSGRGGESLPDGQLSSDAAGQPDGLTDDGDSTVAPDGIPDDTPDVGGNTGYDLYLLDVDALEDEPLSVYAVEPSKGKTVGGEQVVVTGSGFMDGMTIFFGYQKATDVYVMASGKKATAVTPAGFPGPVDVEVINPTGAKAVLEGGFLYFNMVDIISVEPHFGPTTGGVPILVTGTGFGNDTTLIIGTKIAIDTKIMDDSTLLAVTPPGAPGLANVSVSSKDGLDTLLQGFFYYDYPKIVEISPATGSAGGGSVVHINMKGAHQEANVLFGDTEATKVTFVNFGLLEVISPQSTVGYVHVTVTTPFGSHTRENGFFYYGGNLPPKDLQLVSVQPPSGPTSGGNEVQITAFGLTSVEDSTVLFGNKVAQVEEVLPALMLLTVTAPASQEGPVDVTVMNSNGTGVIPDGYTYLPLATIFDVTPDHGPASGGTNVVISGEGFLPGATVQFGALPAADAAVLQPTKITATTPMGSPGNVDVMVMQAGTTAEMVNGFTYDGDLELFVVEPNFGAVSGGTFITLIGSGFVQNNAEVYVAGAPCSHVTVEGYNVISAKTPPGVPGTFDVSVAMGEKTALLPLSFTYFDPVSFYGGTWGGKVYHAVNVTVLDGNTGAPLADAFVMLWADPDTPYQAFTDLNGQVTFSGPDLMGEQMVTASKECYSNSSVVEYNATNVTLYLFYNCPSMGAGGGPPWIPPIIKGRVEGLDKYVVIPPGPCNYNGPDYPFLCQGCTENEECGGPGNLCFDLGDQGKKCLTACADDSECPLGFSCSSVQGGGTDYGLCKPVGGTKVTFCSTSKGHFLAANPLNGKDAEADEDGYFTLILDNLGEFAVICLSGVLPICYGDFDCNFGGSVCDNNGCWMHDGRPEMTPHAMGVARHISVTKPGQVIEDVNVQMNVPMSRKVNVYLDNPHLSWEGPNQTLALAYIDFGSDGVFEFMEIPAKFFGWSDEAQSMTFHHLPTSLSGNLDDATFAVFGGALTSNGGDVSKQPQTFALLTNLTEFEDDTMLVKGTEGWESQPSGIKHNLYDLWGDGWTNVYGVGTDGTVVHFNGYSWQIQQSPGGNTLRSIDGADGLIWAVGDEGEVVRFNGSIWEKIEYPKIKNLTGVWTSAATNVVVVGEYVIEVWDGSQWTTMPGSTAHKFNAVWGVNSQNVWAVADLGKIVRYENGSWTSQVSPTGHTLRDIWGTGPADVWAVGDGGTVIHFDGIEWTVKESGVLNTLKAVYGMSENDVYIVGNKGVLLHYDGVEFINETQEGVEQDLLTVFGSEEAGLVLASGNHQIVLGPFVTPVTIVYPEDGSVIDQNYLQWHADEGGPDASYHSVALQQPSMMGPPIMFWDFMADGDVSYVDLPDFPNIEGTPGVPPGFYIYSISRVFKEGFDIDNYDFLDFDYRTWRSWSQIQSNFISE